MVAETIIVEGQAVGCIDAGFSVTRILAAKAALKLHVKRANGTLAPDCENLSVIGCEQHKAWAKECADKAITLVKDTQNLLPITPQKRKRVLFEIMGKCPSEERVAKR